MQAYDERAIFQAFPDFLARDRLTLAVRAGEISLLPALPTGWSDGAVSGLRARGGFEVAIEWRSGRLHEALITSDLGNPCAIRHGERTVRLTLARGASVRVDADLASIDQR